MVIYKQYDMVNSILYIDKASIQKSLHHNAYHSTYGVGENSVDHFSVLHYAMMITAVCG